MTTAADATRTPGSKPPGVRARPGDRRRKAGRPSFWGAVYVLPSFAILVLILLVPLALSFYYSFTDYSILDSPEPNGGQNYVRLVSDPAFKRALWTTLLYTIMVVPVQTFISMLIANAVARRFRGIFGSVVRSTLFIPVIASMLLVGAVWRAFLGSDAGVLNQFLGLFGVAPVNWLGRPALALVMVAVVTVWKNIGYFLVIYYAGVMDIPSERYEAAQIDGASAWQQFRYVTIPGLRPVTLLVVILGTIWSFQVFDLVYSLTGGGPGGATVTLVMEIYRVGFKNYELGYASAMAVVLFFIVLLISVIQRRLLAKEDA